MFGNDTSELRARVAKLERMVAFFEKHLGVTFVEEVPAGASARVWDLVRQGDKIGAIKVYRQETGAGLREAKEFVDSLE